MPIGLIYEKKNYVDYRAFVNNRIALVAKGNKLVEVFDLIDYTAHILDGEVELSLHFHGVGGTVWVLFELGGDRGITGVDPPALLVVEIGANLFDVIVGLLHVN